MLSLHHIPTSAAGIARALEDLPCCWVACIGIPYELGTVVSIASYTEAITQHGVLVQARTETTVALTAWRDTKGYSKLRTNQPCKHVTAWSLVGILEPTLRMRAKPKPPEPLIRTNYLQANSSTRRGVSYYSSKAAGRTFLYLSNA